MRAVVALIGFVVVVFCLMASGYAPPQYMGWSLAGTGVLAIGFIALLVSIW